MRFFFQTLIELPRSGKKFILIILDSVLLIAVLIGSFSMRLGYWYLPSNELIWMILLSPVVAIPIFTYYGMYRHIVRYIGFNALWSSIKAVSIYALVWGLIVYMSSVSGIPRSVILINWFVSMIAITSLRMSGYWLFSSLPSKEKDNESNKIVIYGAGSAGRQLAMALSRSSKHNQIAFIDDKFENQNTLIDGIEVFPISDLKDLVIKNSIKEVFIAIPSLTNTRRKEILNYLEPLAVNVKSLPSLNEMAQGKIKIADLYDISITDLLNREPVSKNKNLLSFNIFNKVVVVTGAGGTIGSELCRQVLSLKPQMLILYELSEYSLYMINKELSSNDKVNIKIVPILGSVNNKKRLIHVFKKFQVNTVYHAAAFKHVPLVEFNNAEGVSNNIFGTLSCAMASIDTNVDTFVMISTDKAVRPANTMGATKRFAEMIIQALSESQNKLKTQDNNINDNINNNSNFSTLFSIVRFGNVLGSSGSVIPLFKEQIKDGGPVTLTHLEVLRYFMTIPEAVGLVIQAGGMSTGGDVFILDMGKPVKIIDLAKKMIHLSGLEIKDNSNPNGDIEIKITGLRPGEKLYEELLIGDKVSDTEHPMIIRAEEEMMAWDELKLILAELEVAIDEYDYIKLRKLLIKAVPGFKPANKINDLLFNG